LTIEITQDSSNWPKYIGKMSRWPSRTSALLAFAGVLSASMILSNICYTQAFAQTRTDFTAPQIELLFSITGNSHFESYNFARGETARFDAKALVLDEGNIEERSAEGIVFEVEITDPKNNTIFSQNFTANSKGEFNFSLPITDDLRPGWFELHYNSDQAELIVHSEGFNIVASESEFVDLSDDYSLGITVPSNSLKYGDSFLVKIRLCPAINFAEVSDEGFIDPTTGLDVLSDLQWIILVFELESDGNANPLFRSTYLKSDTCGGTLEIADGFLPSPGKWSMNVTARWVGTDGLRYQVKSENSTDIFLDAIFASKNIESVQFPEGITSSIAILDWNSEKSSIVARLNDNGLVVYSSDTGKILSRIANSTFPGYDNSANPGFYTSAKRIRLSADSEGLYLLNTRALYKLDYAGNIMDFKRPTYAYDFDVISDGRIVYSMSDGFWIANANGENAEHLLSYPVDEYSTMDVSPDGSHLVFGNNGKWTVIDIATGDTIDVPRWGDAIGCEEKAVLAPSNAMVVFNYQACAYRGGPFGGLISIIALDGGYREYIVPPGRGIPELYSVSDDGSQVMFSMGDEGAEFADITPSPHGIYVMSLAKNLPEFGSPLAFIMMTVAIIVAITATRRFETE